MVTGFKQGDILLLDFHPQSGYEIRGRRPALVVSNDVYNRFHNLLLVCPITNTDRNLPFHIRLDSRTKTRGVILCDQIRSLDISARNGEFLEKAPDDLVSEVIDLIISFIEANAKNAEKENETDKTGIGAHEGAANHDEQKQSSHRP